MFYRIVFFSNFYNKEFNFVPYNLELHYSRLYGIINHFFYPLNYRYRASGSAI